MKLRCASLSILISASFISCDDNQASAKKKAEGDTIPQISFRYETAELGQGPFKTHANHDFVFSNTGSAPLKIIEVRGSCHCVQGKWPEHPINPGDSGIISVSFDPEEVVGRYIRTLFVRSNAKRDSVQLTISGEILPKAK